MNPLFLSPYISVLVMALLLQATLEHWLERFNFLPKHSLPIAAWGLTAFTGYLAFWAYLGAMTLGWTFTGATFLIVGAYWICNSRDIRGTFLGLSDGHLCRFSIVLIWAFCLGVLHLYESDQPPESLAANRFIPSLPEDNIFPKIIADRLSNNKSPKGTFIDWQSSDRPPLQTGFILLLRPPLKWMGARSARAFAASTLFQLLWVPGIWALLRGAGTKRKETLSAVGLVACTGFCLLHTVYTWPKLGSSGLVIGGASLFFDRSSGSQIARWSSGSALCALAFLAHGGVMFSLLALAPLTLLMRPTKMMLAASLGVFLLLMLPWICYQRFYDPPGNRLIKWHIGGAIPIDNRGVLETIYTSYRDAGWSETVKNKEANIAELFRDGPWYLFDLSLARMRDNRAAEFFHFFRGLGLSSWLLLLLPWPAWCLRKEFTSTVLLRHTALITAWGTLTLIVWALLLFGPGTTIIHQGSLVPLLTLWTLPVVVLARWWRSSVIAIALLQLTLFITIWTAPWFTPDGPFSTGALILALTSISMFGLLMIAIHREPVSEG